MSERENGPVFEIIQSIGHGGQADVYLVRLRATGGLYAGKFLREAWDPLAREQFAREANRQQRAAGEHVVPVIACNLEAAKPFLILEYMPHGSLADEMMARGTYTERDALAIIHRIAIALADLHERRIVHRDLKPGNVLRAADGGLKLNDLGIAATMTASEYVRTRTFVGTPAYAAPEQFGGIATPKSDVYALGIILQELVTGSPAGATPLRGRLGELVARLSAREAWLRPTAREAVGLIATAWNQLRAPAEGRRTIARTFAADTKSASSPWPWLLGMAAVGVGGAALFSRGSATWDSDVGRYRGSDGRFKRG